MTPVARKRKHIDKDDGSTSLRDVQPSGKNPSTAAQETTQAEYDINPPPNKRIRVTKGKSSSTLEDHNDSEDAAPPKKPSRVTRKTPKTRKTRKTRNTGIDAVRPQTVPFTALPPEIRNEIYELICTDAKETLAPEIFRYGIGSRSMPQLVHDANKPTKKPKDNVYRFRHFGLAQTCRLMGQEFGPLINPLQPRVVNLKDIYNYLGVSDLNNPGVHKGVIALDAFFVSPEGIDILPLIRIIGQSPELHIDLFHTLTLAGAEFPQKLLPLFPDLGNLLWTYSFWNELASALDLQSICIHARNVSQRVHPKPGDIEYTIRFVIRQFDTAVVQPSKKPVIDPVNWKPYYTRVVIDKRAKYLTEILYRSRIARAPRGIKVVCDMGRDYVTWKTIGEACLEMTVEPVKMYDWVLEKPKRDVRVIAPSSDVEWAYTKRTEGEWAFAIERTVEE